MKLPQGYIQICYKIISQHYQLPRKPDEEFLHQITSKDYSHNTEELMQPKYRFIFNFSLFSIFLYVSTRYRNYSIAHRVKH